MGIVEHVGKDDVLTVRETAVGPEGMRPDRELFARFAERVRADEQIKQAVEREQWDMAARPCVPEIRK